MFLSKDETPQELTRDEERVSISGNIWYTPGTSSGRDLDLNNRKFGKNDTRGGMSNLR